MLYLGHVSPAQKHIFKLFFYYYPVCGQLFAIPIPDTQIPPRRQANHRSQHASHYSHRGTQLMKRLFSKNSGFTLVELLATTAIIVVLASIVMTSVTSAKYRANDAKRRSDLKMLAIALAKYHFDYGSYPIATGPFGWMGNSVNGGLHATDYIPGLVPNYISVLPLDPDGDSTGWGGAYLYYSDGQHYKLVSHAPLHSSVANTPMTDEFYDSGRPTWAWAVCSDTSVCVTKDALGNPCVTTASCGGW